MVITYEHPAEEVVIMGTDAVNHLKHHGINTVLHRIKSRPGDVAARLMEDTERRKVDLIVMGGYGYLCPRERCSAR